GKVDVRQLGSPTGHSTPQLALWNDNTFRLVVGSESGRIYMYTDIENNLAPNSQFTPISNDLSNLDIGAFAKPALADLNNDGLVDVVVGTYNGGLLYYQQSDIADALPNVPKNADIRIYPNPTNGQLTIELNNNFAPNTQLLIYDICGKLVLSETLSSAQNTHTLTLGHLPSGVCMLHLRNNGLNLVQKVVVR
ncbi:MAG: T9SS type A sorting domain-containing protein, partial [Chitinophagales bacterium]|nr:T9SS type A sorting domain-containing protein [Chitinophagales bacterium]